MVLPAQFLHTVRCRCAVFVLSRLRPHIHCSEHCVLDSLPQVNLMIVASTVWWGRACRGLASRDRRPCPKDEAASQTVVAAARCVSAASPGALGTRLPVILFWRQPGECRLGETRRGGERRRPRRGDLEEPPEHRDLTRIIL